MVLAAVSDGIRRILWNSFAADPTVRPLVGTEEAIVFLNPTQTAQDSSNRVSLWLYLIAENEFLKNTPPQRVADGTEQFPPLALDLYYLLTPFGPSAEADLLILGRAMQALYDSARTTLINPQAVVAEDLSINLFRRTLDELSRVWEALQEPYRLSVCYQVRVTRVDSTLSTTVHPVLEMTTDFTQDLDPGRRAMTTPLAEARVTRACAIFSVTDSFVILRGVDGPGAARQARGPVGFRLTAIGSGAARQPLAPGWTLPVVQGISGAFISYGIIADPSGWRSRPSGPPLAVDVTVTGPAYRVTSPVGLQLVNLDPAQPTAAVAPVPVQLAPGYGYPFPATPVGYSLVRGEVLTRPGRRRSRPGAGHGHGPRQATGPTPTSPTAPASGCSPFPMRRPARSPSPPATRRVPRTRRQVTVTASSTIAVPALIPP